MEFQTPLIPATLVRRYKRFLADVILPDGREVTAHCANPGSMRGLVQPGSKVWVEPNDDPKRKLNYGWRLTELDDGHWVGIDTSIPNKIVGEALEARAIKELSEYGCVRAEVPYGENSRVDFLLTQAGQPDVYLEVKNVHFRRESDWAEFPDSVTKRGAKHLGELSEMVRQGHRAVMLYLVQRTDCRRFRLAADYDAEYARAYELAKAAGVETLCFGTHINAQRIIIGDRLPVAVCKQI